MICCIPAADRVGEQAVHATQVTGRHELLSLSLANIEVLPPTEERCGVLPN
jgi:hypothetical protein